jgi:hypothetical protein
VGKRSECYSWNKSALDGTIILISIRTVNTSETALRFWFSRVCVACILEDHWRLRPNGSRFFDNTAKLGIQPIRDGFNQLRERYCKIFVTQVYGKMWAGFWPIVKVGKLIVLQDGASLPLYRDLTPVSPEGSCYRTLYVILSALWCNRDDRLADLHQSQNSGKSQHHFVKHDVATSNLRTLRLEFSVYSRRGCDSAHLGRCDSVN